MPVPNNRFMKRLSLFFLVLTLCLTSSTVRAQQKMADLIAANFRFAENQYKLLMQHITPGKMPQRYEQANNNWVNMDIQWWCSGFYPGSLWYIYEQTGNTSIKQEAERALELIKPNQFFTDNHDLGFMMYCSFGNAYRITGNEAYKQPILNAADALITRFRPGIPAIQSWNKSKKFNCPVIIDNMMNLELLEWAARNGGNKKGSEIARLHTQTTTKNHYRPDYSSYHVIDYDTATGAVLQKRTQQGYADNSAWSRGQAWGLYGYVMMYRFTKNKQYLQQAQNIAGFILNHPNLPADKVPYWDFNAPNIPDAVRDVSAAAITASALLELGQYTKGKQKERYLADATTILHSLNSDKYKAAPGTNGGYLLLHSTGAFPSNSEVDVPLIYADYYFLEALKRYKDWYLK